MREHKQQASLDKICSLIQETHPDIWLCNGGEDDIYYPTSEDLFLDLIDNFDRGLRVDFVISGNQIYVEIT